MQASVYRLRDRGVRLPRPTTPASGMLSMRPIERGREQHLQAELRTSDHATYTVVPVLYQARVRRITANGLVITGVEEVARGTHPKANVERFKQTWWVLVHTVGALAAVGLDDAMDERMEEGAAK